MLAPGAQLGSYQILAPLGSGGMGVVYRAKDHRLGRVVAIKILPPATTQDPIAQQRFLDEARAASALDHVNICTVHQVDETPDGQMYLVMACYDGETLQARIARGVLDLATAVDIARQTALGLGHAHGAGLVHRDIKPANVLVTSGGVVKILDFGLAKLSGAENRTQPGAIVGTLSYMSPEQVRGQVLDARSDIWALGVVLYEMLAGRNPFDGQSLLSLPHAIASGAVRLPIPGRDDVPPSLVSVLRRALARDRDDRYRSAAEMLADLSHSAAAPVAPTLIYTHPKVLPSIAVLVFADMSPAKDQAYFCEGMAEELINALTALDGIRVAARRSSFQFKGDDGDLCEIGAKLNVGAVLEGSVRKAGNRLRVTAQLVDAGNGYQLWSDRYDGELDDVFGMQDEIARKIVGTLRVRLLGDPQQALVTPHTADLDAYNAYLMGRHCRFTLYDLARAIESFERAVQIDPQYARADAALADCFNVLGLYSALPPHAAAIRVRAVAARALHHDPMLAEAHAALAQGQFLFDWNWGDAERAFRRAIGLNPSLSETSCWFGYFLAATGRAEEGLAEVRKTSEHDPLSAYTASYAAVILYVLRRFEEATEEARRALALQPGFGVAVNLLALTCAARHRFDEALAHAEALVNSSGRTSHGLQTLGVMLAHAGHHERAHGILTELEQRAHGAYVSPICLGDIHAALGNLDQAFALFERAYAERAPTLHTLRFPSHDALRADPRWASLVQRMMFPA